jgi:hypothetical protein
VTARFILPRADRPLQSPFSLCPVPLSIPTDRSRPNPIEGSLTGVPRSLFAASARGVHLSRGDPSSTLRSALGVPPALDGLLHHVPCGFVSPHNHVQGSPFRGSTTSRSRTGFSPAPALLPFRRPHLRPRSRRHVRLRLQGFAPRDEYDGLRWTVRSTRTPCPSWDLSPPGTRTEPLERLHVPSTHGLHHEEPFAADPRRLASSVVIALEPDRSTRTRFSA